MTPVTTETKWCDPEQKPIAVDVYKRLFLNSPRYSFWNGSFWGVLVNTVERAIEYKDAASELQDLPWCGLAREAA